MRTAAILAALLACASTASAQSMTDVEVNKAFSLAWTPSVGDVPEGLALDYRIYQDGNEVTGLTIPAPVAGTIEVRMPAFTSIGRRTFRVSARYRVVDTNIWAACPAAGCPEAFATGDAIANIVGATVPAPPIPGNFRIVLLVTQQSGQQHPSFTIESITPVLNAGAMLPTGAK